MKNKGFTLIELLAVIVILAVIALIAVPIILNVVEKSTKGSKESSMLGYVDAIEKQIMMVQVKGETPINTGVYSVEQLTNRGVTVKGDTPDSGTFRINEKGSVSEGWALYGEYKVYYNGKKAVASKEKYLDESGTEHNEIPTPGTSTETYAVGEAVYLDPTNLSTTCDAENSVSTPGTKTGCMKWYVIKDNGSSIDVLLDHNTTATVAWNSNESDASMGEVSTQLSTDTQGWSGSPRLITANEVATITGNAGWDSITATSSQTFYFGSNNTTNYSNQTEEQKARHRSFAWLFDYTNGCTSYGCNTEDSSTYAYWTSSPVSDDSSRTWLVDYRGRLNTNFANNASFFGVRPVIELEKSIFN